MTRPSPDPVIILRGHIGGVSSLCFLSQNINIASGTSGEWLLSGSDKGEIFVWNLETFRITYKLPAFHGTSQVLWLESWRDYVLTQGRDGFLKLLHFSSYDNEWLEDKNVTVASLSFCKCSILDETSLVSAPGCKTSEAIIIDLEKEAEIISSLVPESSDDKFGMLMCSKLAPEYCLLCGYENGDIILWNWKEVVVISNLNFYKEPVFAMAFDCILQRGIITSATNQVHTWKVTSENKLEALGVTKTTNPGISTVDIRQDSRIVATGGSDGRIRVFSWKTMKALAVLNWHKEMVNCVRFSARQQKNYGLLLAAGSKDGLITLWSLYK